MHMCEQIVQSLEYLIDNNLTQEQLSKIHHFSLKSNRVTFKQIRNYFGRNIDLRERNHSFGERIISVAEMVKKDITIDAATDEVLIKYPLIW